ncbi:MAG: GMC family oxidoreductase [Spirochaetes bacterium]|nr:GMC family oxidoreductase [Spirochaetota bacterium]
MIRTYRDYRGDFTETCEVCVIGSGPGGGVVAKELAEKGRDVVLLEEGGYFTAEDWDGRPARGIREMYRGCGTTGTLGNPFISVTLGKCVGGTSTVNSATCFRTPSPVLKKWRDELGLVAMTEDTLAPYFDRVEKIINVTELPWDLLGNNAKIVKRGCDAFGYSCRPLKHNVRSCRGCGTCQFGCQENAKQSVNVTYVPLADGFGARIYANCRAERIVASGGAAVGVEAVTVDPVSGRRTGSVSIRSQAVVVSCGAMITPSFLMRNGLRNRHLGRHLQIHPAGRVVALMDEVVEGWKGVSQGAYIDDFEDEGIMMEGVMVHPSLLLAALPGVGREHKEMAVRYNNLAVFGVMAHDETEGRVLKGFGKKGRGITALYQIRKSDAEKLKRGIAYLSRIFFAAGARRVYTSISKMPVLDSAADAERLLSLRVKPSQIETMAFHPLGTCRMATGPERGPVDPCGESFELKNLYVADAGVIPTSLGVNPQVTIMALSNYIADGINRRLAASPSAHSGRYKPS